MGRSLDPGGAEAGVTRYRYPPSPGLQAITVFGNEPWRSRPLAPVGGITLVGDAASALGYAPNAYTSILSGFSGTQPPTGRRRRGRRPQLRSGPGSAPRATAPCPSGRHAQSPAVGRAGSYLHQLRYTIVTKSLVVDGLCTTFCNRHEAIAVALTSLKYDYFHNRARFRVCFAATRMNPATHPIRIALMPLSSPPGRPTHAPPPGAGEFGMPAFAAPIERPASPVRTTAVRAGDPPAADRASGAGPS